jgi:proteic killer suppression protein
MFKKSIIFVTNQETDMEIMFEKRYLRELYETGKTSDKKHRFQPEIIKAYAKCVYRMEEAAVPEELYKYRSLRFETLKGDKKGLCSVRVNDKYRIEFTTKQVVSETVVIICNIIELSNHYE